MYKGFNLSLGNSYCYDFIEQGKEIHDKNKAQVKNKLDSFKDRDENLIASRIVANWFPPIEADIFLSHSHKDEDQVIGFSGWLKQEFGLNSFIDSCIWGYSETLLKIIDNEYCYNQSSDTYSYQKRNRSTCHVHMMLLTALTKMINNCECIIFVNTPQSISPKKYIEDAETTDSPWIYSEISMTSLVQKRSRSEHRGIMVKSEVRYDSIKPFTIKYDVDLMHLSPLTVNDLINWKENNTKKGPESLDSLYKLME